MKIITEAFAMKHSRRDRPSGLSDWQWTNLKVCPYSGVFEGGRVKYIVLVGDGMGDYAVPELGGRTPLQAAHKPNIDRLALNGGLGRGRVCPGGFLSWQ